MPDVFTKKKRSQVMAAKRSLSAKGWTVIRLWEHDLARPRYCTAWILRALSKP